MPATSGVPNSLQGTENKPDHAKLLAAQPVLISAATLCAILGFSPTFHAPPSILLRSCTGAKGECLLQKAPTAETNVHPELFFPGQGSADEEAHIACSRPGRPHHRGHRAPAAKPTDLPTPFRRCAHGLLLACSRRYVQQRDMLQTPLRRERRARSVPLHPSRTILSELFRPGDRSDRAPGAKRQRTTIFSSLAQTAASSACPQQATSPRSR